MGDGDLVEAIMGQTPWRPLRITAVSMLVIALGLGLVLGQLTDTASSTDAAEPATDPPPETDVLGAVETRSDESGPVGVDHLVIVAVSVTTCGERSSGTGVLVAENTILTAAHTVGEAGLVQITYGTQIFTGEVVGVFADGRDLAVIDLRAPLDEPIAATTAPLDGAEVTIVGFPEGGPRSSVTGPVVGVPELAQRLWIGPLAAVDAPTRAGMSGGPAVDHDGNLIGLLVAAQPESGTAVIAAIDDVSDALEAPLVDGRCPKTA